MNRLFTRITKFTPLRPSTTPTLCLILAIGAILVTAGCAAGRRAYQQGIEAEVSRNYEEALTHYQEALREDPGEIEYRLKVEQARFAAAYNHFENGRRALEADNLEVGRAEFTRTLQLDPTHEFARAELERIEILMQPVPDGGDGRLDATSAAQDFEVRKESARTDPSLELQLSPEISTISFRITQETQAVYETIAELSGLNVIFDPDFRSNQVSVELSDVSVYQALDILGLQTQTFWAPINPNTFIVSPDNQQKRRDYESHILKTIYLTNSVNPTDITEAITAIRTLLNVRFIAQSTSMNAIIIRDTPGRVAIAEKIIDDIDKSKPEVLVEATVLEVDRNTLRELGILPPQGTSVGLTGGDEATAADTQVNLRDLNNLNSGSFNIVIPDSVARFLESDNRTRLVQNPTVRATDGQLATIRIGSRVPVASGSFQPAFVGATGTPVVQFQYIDVGVNMDITPRVLLNREITMQVVVQVQATAGNNIISGVSLPVFTNREITHEIRLSEGETNILGGLITDTESVTSSGIPGLKRIPILGRLFSTETAQRDQTEIIVLLTPHIVKMPDLSDRNLRGLMVGTETNTRFVGLPGAATETTRPVGAILPTVPEPAADLEIGNDRITFDVPVVILEAGGQTQLGVMIDTPDMTGADFTIEFDPTRVALRQISDGGFLSQDGGSIALVQNIDHEQGRAVVTVERPNQANPIAGQGRVLEVTLEVLSGGTSALRFSDIVIRSPGTAPRAAESTEIQVTTP